MVGKGSRTVLLLHGWGDSRTTFEALSARLGKTYRVVAVDLPGFGGSQQPPEAWGLDEYAAWVSAFLDKLAIKPYAVVGHSNGGSIAIRGLSTNVLQADRLVLVASAGIRNTASQGLRRKLWGAVAKAGKAGTLALPRSTRQKLRGKLYAAAGSDMLVAEHMQGTFRRVVNQDVQVDAAGLSQPTLLIYGTLDDATPLAYGQAFAGVISQSKLIKIEDAGHFVHQERPGEVAAVIEEFLK